MFNKLMGTRKVNKDDLAEFLKLNPEALKSFEELYKDISEEQDTLNNNFFAINAKKMAEKMKLNPEVNLGNSPNVDVETINKIKNTIVEELINDEKYELMEDVFLKKESKVTPADLVDIPRNQRPQLTGQFMTKDLRGNSYEALIMQYMKWKEKGDIRFYHSFRQGLDILDLDPITYSIIGENPNSMGYWFPTLEIGVKDTFFKLPKTKIIKVPLTMLQLTRLEYRSLNRTTLDIVNDFCMKAFDLDVNKKYFIKTGTYSSKFDFRNALVQGEQEVKELGEYLLFIHHQALQMASPLSQPSIYGVSTTNEWVVREFIEDVDDNPTIYKGMPLRTEYRFFVDLDTKEILGVSPYWREDVMKKSFSSGEENSHKTHDYVIYKMHEETLYKRYNENVDKLTDEVKKLIFNMDLKGQWSIDIMQNGEDFYVIDMALASQSALNDCVEKPLIIPTENWLPEFTPNVKSI